MIRDESPRGFKVRSLLGLSLLAGSCWATQCVAGDVNARVPLNIPPQDLSSALTTLAAQADLQILVSQDLVVGKRTEALRGDYSATEALHRLLAGAHLDYVVKSTDTIVIHATTGVDHDAESPDTPNRPNVGPPGVSEKAGAVVPDKGVNNTGGVQPSEAGKPTPHRSLWSRLVDLVTCNAKIRECGTMQQPSTERRSRSGWIGGLISIIGAHLIAPIAQAQEGAAAEPAGLQEIVVTAEKFSESLQKAPVAITAVTGEELQKLNITSGLDLGSVVPNLFIGEAGMGANVAMRGVVTNNPTEVGNPDVAFNINGVYLGRQRAALSGLYDLDRVEVLRGPQGTLYGRNATGGSINLITSAPDLTHMYGSGALGYGNYNAVETSGMLNLPISDTFGIRAAMQSVRHDGYVNARPSTQNLQDEDTISGRLTALWKPTDDFSAKLVYEQTHDGGTGGGGFTGGGPLGNYATSSGSSAYRWYVRQSDLFQDDQIHSTTLLLDWHTDLMDIAYVGNYRHDDWHVEGTQAAQGPVSTSGCQVAATPVDLPTDCVSTPVQQDEHQVSHELRFSKNTDFFKGVLGLYYYKEDNNVFNGIDPAPGGPAPWAHVFAFVFPDVEEDSKAIFGQGTFSVSDQARVTVGGRYTKDHKSRAGNFYLAAAGGSIVDWQCVNCAATALAVIPSYADLSWSKSTWKAAFEYDVAPDSMLFASISTGYKAGGYGDGVQPNNNPFNPETLTNYEVGWKSNLLDHRLQLNIDGFHTLYQNYQATSGVASATGQVQAVTVNAAEATIDGIELESTTLVSSTDKLGFNATWLDARFTSFNLPVGDQFYIGPNGPGPCIGCGYSLTGKKLPYAPDFTARIDWEHTFPLANGAALITRIDSQYSASYNVEYHNFPVTAQDAYTRTGFSLTYQANKTWSAMAYVRNIENKAILITGQPDNNASDFAHNGKQAWWMAPRTFGVKASANF